MNRTTRLFFCFLLLGTYSFAQDAEEFYRVLKSTFDDKSISCDLTNRRGSNRIYVYSNSELQEHDPNTARQGRLMDGGKVFDTNSKEVYYFLSWISTLRTIELFVEIDKLNISGNTAAMKFHTNSVVFFEERKSDYVTVKCQLSKTDNVWRLTKARIKKRSIRKIGK